MTALGFIETLGLLPAIEAADAMLKAADVRLVEKSLASGGLVTITVSGEVAAVQASVDAAAASVGRIAGAKLVSKHVIARPDAELSKVFDAKKAVKKEDVKTEAPKAAPGDQVTKAMAKAAQAKAGPAPAPKTPEAPAPKTAPGPGKKSASPKKKK